MMSYKSDQIKQIIAEQSENAIKNLIFLAEKSRKNKNSIDFKEKYFKKAVKYIS